MATAYDLTTAPNPLYQIYESAAPLQRRAHSVDVAEDMPAVTTGDSAKVISIQKGDYVYDVWAQIITPSITSSGTFVVGDSSSANGWITAADGTAAADTVYRANGTYKYTATTIAVTAVAMGKLYTAADNLIFTQGSTAMTSGVFQLNMIVLPKPFTND